MTEESARTAAPDAAPEKPGKRPYTMSPEALAQRRIAAQHSTGPVTEQGKAIASRNAWKHGQYSAANQGALTAFTVGHFGAPCRTTCPKHPENKLAPPEHPCTLVLDGLTKAGGECLDKEVYVRTFDAILQKLETGGMDGMNPVLAAELAGALELTQRLRAQIAEDGILVEKPIFNKEGIEVGSEMVLNPAMAAYNKMLDKLGINFPQLLATPAAAARVDNPDKPTDAVSDLFRTVLARAGGKGPVIRHDVVDGEFTEVKP